MQTAFVQEKAPVWQDNRAIALLLAATLTTMANSTISPALPGLQDTFAGQPHAALLTRLLVPAPSLTVVFCAPIAGLAVDRFGRRGLLLAGIVLFAIAGSAGLYLPDLATIFASRLVLGVAVAMIMTAQTALIGDYFTGQSRNALMGLQISARNFGALVFISSAGLLAVVSSRLPFAIYALAGLYLPFIWATIAEPHARRRDRAVAQSGADGHPAWRMLVLALAGLQMTTNMIFFLMPTQLPFFFEALGYDSAVMTGSALGCLTLMGGCVALFYAQLKRIFGYALVYALGYVAMALGLVLLGYNAQIWVMFAGTAAVGAGYAAVMPGFVALALQIAPEHRRGLCGGIVTSAVFVGQCLSPLISIPAIDAIGYKGVFLGTAVLLAAMAIGAMVFAAVSGRRNQNPG